MLANKLIHRLLVVGAAVLAPLSGDGRPVMTAASAAVSAAVSSVACEARLLACTPALPGVANASTDRFFALL